MSPPAQVALVHDFTLPGRGGPIPVRLYRGIGTDAAANLPCLVYYHGGGWVIGDLDTHDETCRRIASAARCVVLSVDYRLAPEHKFPAAFDDCVAAMRFAVDQASQIGVDADKVAVGGDASGGNLAAAVALAARDAGLKLTQQVLICPATDFAMTLDSHRRVIPGILSPNTRPVPSSDRPDSVGVADQEVPSFLASGDNCLVAIPDQQAQFVAAQVLPDVLHCVEFG